MSLRLPCRGPCGMPTPALPRPGLLLAWPARLPTRTSAAEPISLEACGLWPRLWRSTDCSAPTQPMDQAQPPVSPRAVTSGPAPTHHRVQPCATPPWPGSWAGCPRGRSPLVGAQPSLSVVAPVRLLTASHQRPSPRAQGHSSAQRGAALGWVSGIDTAPVTAQPRRHVPRAPRGDSLPAPALAPTAAQWASEG